ncbi:hypothetical protein LZG74_20085 [Dyadobacter sp. CY327]|uniref:hypothetical protein n=1 Tax=Dyadobacter sp. CY327 TaxID=2907301 RepID=UPI001F308DF4|nr:hypothetical protein [Dyadobacter sp. CY327]MCE7072624.1 hypothetical protein [Dyadobacter sp. CY327]
MELRLIRKPFRPTLTFFMREDKEACLQAGMDHYLSKPLRLDEIKAALQLGFKQIKAY